MSDDLCDMKIKDLRNLANKKNINVRDSKGKLKNKCKLIIEIVKKSSMDDEEMDFGNVQIVRADEEMDLSGFNLERPQPKMIRFGDVTETIIENENKGKKVKGRSYTRRPLSEKELKSFKPSKMSDAKIKKKEQSERTSMGMEDVNINLNDYPEYKMVKLYVQNKKPARVAKLRSETSKSPFRIFEIKNVVSSKDFLLESKNPIGIFNPDTKKISEEFDKPALDRLFVRLRNYKNDSDVYSIMKINDVPYARKRSDMGPIFELYEIEEYRKPNDFSTTGITVPIGSYDSLENSLTLYKKRT